MAKKKKAPAAVVRKAIQALRKEHGWTPSDLIGILRGGGSSTKGYAYEREICKTLSLWWTEGSRDDVFWRSSGSGGRATQRERAGAHTAGQYGDVAATDPIGVPLIEFATIEIKRGYSEDTCHDLVDRLDAGGIQAWEEFFMQSIRSHEQAKSYTWMMITRRTRRAPLIWMPFWAMKDLCVSATYRPFPYIKVCAVVRSKTQTNGLDACGMRLDAFLENISPCVIEEQHP